MKYDNHMTQTLVLATTDFGYPTVVAPALCQPKYGYTAVSEPVTITFKPLPKEAVVAAQLDALDAKEKELRDELADKIATLNYRRAELLALPSPEAQ